MKKLTDKQEQFCKEYLIDLNATQAAIRAGYSIKTAKDIACENLAKPNIQDFISVLKEKRNKRVEITQDEILNELKNFAFSDITDTIELTSEQVKELPIEIRRLIISYKKVKKRYGEKGEWEEEAVELKFIDKMKAFEMLNKHVGFYEKDNKQSKTEVNVDTKTYTNEELKQISDIRKANEEKK